MESKLRKMAENIPDFIEKWPAYAAGRSYASSTISVLNDRLYVLSEVQTKIPNSIPKPKLLEHIQDQIKNKLEIVKPTDVDARLQVFREAFQTFISTLKTYQPLLAYIMNEYENALNHYKVEAQKLRPVKEYLWTLSHEYDERILKLQKKERPGNLSTSQFELSNIELDQMKRQIAKLYETICEEREEKLCLQTEVKRLTRALEEEHDRYRHESDAKHLLISEINGLRIQYEELEGISKQTQIKMTQAGDPVILKIALEQARKAQSASEFEVTRLKADYVDVVPKFEHDKLTAELEAVKLTLKEKQDKLDELMKVIRQQDYHMKNLTTQLEEAEESLNTLKENATPRPDWDQVGQRLPGGLDKWIDSTKAMSSQDKVNYLISALNKQNSDNSLLRSLPSKGDGDDVPLFLRHTMDVHARTIQPRDCQILIDEIWKARMIDKETDQQIKVKKRQSVVRRRVSQIKHPSTSNPKDSPIPQLRCFNEFVAQFFKQNFGLEKIRLEWAYAFYDMLNSNKHNFKMNEFKKIIDNTMDEACHWYLDKWLKRVKQFISSYHVTHITDLPEKSGEVADGTTKVITKQNLREALSVIFGLEAEQSLDKLIQIASEYVILKTENTRQTSGEGLNLESVQLQSKPTPEADDLLEVDKLFLDIPEEDYNPFLRGLISIYEENKAAFISEVATELQKSMPNASESKTISAAQIVHAIETSQPQTAVTSGTRPKSGRLAILDPISPINNEASIEWILKPAMTQQSVNSLPLDIVLSRLKGANFYRSNGEF